MDFQCSDGRSMLLKYVTSYVTKMRDHNILKGLIFFYRYKLFFLKLVIVLLNFLNTSYLFRGMVLEDNIVIYSPSKNYLIR